MMIAALRGKEIFYMPLGLENIMVTAESEGIAIGKDVFEELYYRLDHETAALKENCVEYIYYRDDSPIEYHPNWLSDLVYSGHVTHTMGSSIFHDRFGQPHIMSPDCYFLRNYLGDIELMVPEKFHRYYVTNLMGGL